MLRLVSLAPGPDVGIGAAASLTALPVDQVHAALRQLVAASLITEHPLGRFQLHDLVRLYAAEWAREVEPVEHRTRAVHRVLDHYLHTAHAAALCLEPQRICATPAPCAPGVTALPPTDPGAAVTWFTAEHDVLLAAVDLAADTGFDAHVWQLACSLTTFFDRRGHWHDRVVTQRAALAAARRLADRWAQAHSHRGLALAYTLLGRFDDAGEELRSALDLFEELADPVGQARSYRSLARVWAQQGRHDLALPYDRRSLEVYQAIGHRSGQATALNAIGWHHAHLGDHEQALAYCQEALVLQEEMDDRHAQGATLDSLGFAHHQLGQDGPAIDCYQRALRLYRETGERYLQAGTLGRLGDARHAAGDREGARRAWQQAIDVLDELGHPDANLIREKLHRPDRTALLSAR